MCVCMVLVYRCTCLCGSFGCLSLTPHLPLFWYMFSRRLSFWLDSWLATPENQLPPVSPALPSPPWALLVGASICKILGIQTQVLTDLTGQELNHRVLSQALTTALRCLFLNTGTTPIISGALCLLPGWVYLKPHNLLTQKVKKRERWIQSHSLSVFAPS